MATRKQKVTLYRFPFLQNKELMLGDLSSYPTTHQSLNKLVSNFKFWKNIKDVPHLINEYPDEAYSCVTAVLASQLGKLLQLHCEETFFAELDGKPVTATAFHECITVLENDLFEMYPLTSSFLRQSIQKQIFYFLIQNYNAYAYVNTKLKERLERHYVDSSGNAFLSNHSMAAFLTPQQLPVNIIVKLHINHENYLVVRDFINKVGKIDLTEVAFDSIPKEMVQAHDVIAEKINKPTFEQKKLSFHSNWQRLIEAKKEFEELVKVQSE